jgi:hypothetical protein
MTCSESIAVGDHEILTGFLATRDTLAVTPAVSSLIRITPCDQSPHGEYYFLPIMMTVTLVTVVMNGPARDVVGDPFSC